ncbi:MAG: ATP-dependent DNA helicase RecQ [Weeksellaceae bacterium]|nr:ATP-dependent DNA helicase RecQ [Weeksellaceae bacterium]
MTPKQVLSKYWGYENFRDQQEQIIQSLIDGKDVFALMPTGGGKSLTFQVPALVMPGVAIVISPLIALMKDQVLGLTSRGINAAMISSENTAQDIRVLLDNARYGFLKLLYISPERFFSENFRHNLSFLPISFFAIDEAHCISEWGHDFRPSYLAIDNIKKDFPQAPIIALTATATPLVQKEIMQQLQLQSPKKYISSLRRPNLSYRTQSSDNKWNDLLISIARNPGSSIVFCHSRKLTYELSTFLNSQGVEADFYHARIPFAEKEKKQKQFIASDRLVLCATNAFGMGIDKADIRTVYHMNMPSSIEAYFQEVGRAGRDGKPARGILFYDEKDQGSAFRFFKAVMPTKSEFLHIIKRLYNYYQIAENELSPATFSFSQRKFAETFDLNRRKVKMVVDFLDNQGVINVASSDSGSRVQILISSKNWVSGGDFEHELLNYIARTYPGVFQSSASISEHQIAYHLSANRNKVRDTLHVLSSKNQIKYRDASIIHIRFLQIRNDNNAAQQLWPQFRNFHKHRFDKLADAHFYANNQDVCTSVLLLRYFGEKSSQICGKCHVCLPEPKASQSDMKQELLRLLQSQTLSLKHIISHFRHQPQNMITELLQKLVNEREIIFIFPDKYTIWKNQ